MQPQNFMIKNGNDLNIILKDPYSVILEPFNQVVCLTPQIKLKTTDSHFVIQEYLPNQWISKTFKHERV